MCVKCECLFLGIVVFGCINTREYVIIFLPNFQINNNKGKRATVMFFYNICVSKRLECDLKVYGFTENKCENRLNELQIYSVNYGCYSIMFMLKYRHNVSVNSMITANYAIAFISKVRYLHKNTQNYNNTIILFIDLLIEDDRYILRMVFQ